MKEFNEIKVFKRPNTALYYVAYGVNGVCPGDLEGHFTSPTLAQKAIDGYMSELVLEEEKRETARAYVDSRKKEIAEELELKKNGKG